MVNRLFIIIVVVFLAGLSPADGARSSPAITGTRPSPGTSPSRGYNSALVRSPNPIDTSGNLVVTGNVRGGRHFRGIVPYQSTTYFGGTTPSSSLDSFLRYSAGSEDIGSFSREPLPYYSPTRTVTSVTPGQTSIFRPPTSLYGTYVSRNTASDATGVLLPRQYQRSTTYPTSSIITNTGTRPLSMTTKQLQETLSDEINKYPYITKPLPADENDKQRTEQIKQLQTDLKLPQSKSLAQTQPVQKPPAEDKPVEVHSQIDAYDQIGLYDPTGDIYEQMKYQLDNSDSQKPFEFWRPKPKKQSDQTNVIDDEETSAQPKSSPAPLSEPTTEQGLQRQTLLPDEIPGTDSSTKAKSVLDPYKSFTSSSLTDQFNKHIRAAENYLKEGKYYKAANAYTLASIYKPTDPLVDAGISHALFAAGEYMSSALYLYKTLQTFPEYARFKIDIVAMFGDRDIVETRIADVEQHLKINDSPELHFLLGYVYYQIGRLNKAKEQADIAYEKMPGVLAAMVLKEAVDNAAK